MYLGDDQDAYAAIGIYEEIAFTVGLGGLFRVAASKEGWRLHGHVGKLSAPRTVLEDLPALVVYIIVANVAYEVHFRATHDLLLSQVVEPVCPCSTWTEPGLKCDPDVVQSIKRTGSFGLSVSCSPRPRPHPHVEILSQVFSDAAVAQRHPFLEIHIVILLRLVSRLSRNHAKKLCQHSVDL